MKYGYVRVEKKEEIEAQQVQSMIDTGVDPKHVFIDRTAGGYLYRDYYRRMLKHAKKGDIIVVKNLDSFGDFTDEIRFQFKMITTKSVHINVLDTPKLNTDQVVAGGVTMRFSSDLILAVLSYVSEQERDNIKQRQREGIEAAKRSGKVLGRTYKIHKDFVKLSKSVSDGNMSVLQACELMNISRKTYYNHLKFYIIDNA